MKYLREILLGALVLVFVSLLVTQCQQDREAEWENRVERLQGAYAATSERYARALRAEEARADSAESRAQDLDARRPVVRERIDSVRVETPPELENHPAIVQRDQIIDSLVVSRDAWRGLFREEQAANVRLRGLLEETRAHADSLSAVLDDRPGPRPWYVPTVTVGPQAGLDPMTGRPYKGVGVTLGWEVEI